MRGKNHFRREKNWLKLQSHKIINVESKSILRGFEDRSTVKYNKNLVETYKDFVQIVSEIQTKT